MTLCYDREPEDIAALYAAEGRIDAAGDITFASAEDLRFTREGTAKSILYTDGTAVVLEDGPLEAGCVCVRGAYNASDLNRVGRKVLELKNKLLQRGYLLRHQPRTDWTESEIQTPASIAAYLAGISEIRGILPVMPGTPPVPTDFNRGVTQKGANDIELILKNTELVLAAMDFDAACCGDVFAGEAF